MENVQERYYFRFTLEQRYLHWALAGTFLGLAFTGLPLRFSTNPAMQTLARTVGGFGAVLFFHKFCAVGPDHYLPHSPGRYRLPHRGQTRFGLLWGPNSMVPRLKDIQDFFGNMKWFLHLGPKPRFDRFAYWDKLDYWGVFWGMAIIGFSGYAMWFGSFFARIIPGSWLNIALVIHGEEAILATGWIFVIHFFNTHLRAGQFSDGSDHLHRTGQRRRDEASASRRIRSAGGHRRVESAYGRSPAALAEQLRTGGWRCRACVGPVHAVSDGWCVYKRVKRSKTTMKIIAVSAAVLSLSGAAFAADAEAGHAAFDKSCKGCHGAAGVPNPAIAKMFPTIPDLTSAKLQADSDADMKKAITDGKGAMKPVKNLAGSPDDVVAFIRTLKK